MIVVRPAESDEGKNWYQRATGWLERTGLPGVNPAIQAAAYATGLDYKAPCRGGLTPLSQ